jgi:hypothetical protein
MLCGGDKAHTLGHQDKLYSHTTTHLHRITTQLPHDYHTITMAAPPPTCITHKLALVPGVLPIPQHFLHVLNSPAGLD